MGSKPASDPLMGVKNGNACTAPKARQMPVSRHCLRALVLHDFADQLDGSRLRCTQPEGDGAVRVRRGRLRGNQECR
jgi:hypothetical protein